jgi:hypothetical protein
VGTESVAQAHYDTAADIEAEAELSATPSAPSSSRSGSTWIRRGARRPGPGVFAAGDYLNHDLAGYHVPVCADIEGLEAVWVDEADDRINPLGAKGIGELGIVGRDPDR